MFRRLGSVSNYSNQGFSHFADKCGYDGRVPSTRFFAHALSAWYESMQPYFDLEVQKRGACELSLDASMKVPKHIKEYGGQKIFKSLYTGASATKV